MAAHRRLLAEEEPERLLEVALEALIGFLDADRGFALLREADGRPRLRAVHNVDLETVRAPHFRPLRRIADETLRQGEPFLSASLDADTRVSPESSLVDAARTVMVLPVRARDHVLGVLYADRYHEGDGGFVVAGYDYSFYDRLDLSHYGGCSVNLLTSRYELTLGPGDDAAEIHREGTTEAASFPLASLTESYAPPICMDLFR